MGLNIKTQTLISKGKKVSIFVDKFDRLQLPRPPLILTLSLLEQSWVIGSSKFTMSQSKFLLNLFKSEVFLALLRNFDYRLRALRLIVTMK